MCIEWQFPDSVQSELPKELHNIFAGECRWSLAGLPELHDTYRSWIQDCFSDPKKPYDRIWHNKFPIGEVGNGDMLAIDIGKPKSQPVVYLSHDDSREHGYRLGSDIQDYIDRLTLLGCVGPECWQFSPFLKGPRAFLQTSSKAAKTWRRWFGLEFSV